MLEDHAPHDLGLYVHVPFCRRKCRYCDFYSVPGTDRLDCFVQALCREMAAATAPAPADTLYFGGGTPSLLSAHAVSRILAAAVDRCRLTDRAEITLEANPGTVTRASLKAFREIGINRLNLGVQAFDDEALTFLGRIHSAREGCAAVDAARDAGFENLGIDLIYGLPGQTPGAWEKTLEAAVGLGCEHLSCYLLSCEPGTPLEADRRCGRYRPLSETRLGRLFRITHGFLTERGYDHYEISNFARTPGHRSRHNTKYWDGAPYLGFGPSAHSFLPPERSWNVASLDGYLARIAAGRSPRSDQETLDRRQQMIEAVYLGLRRSCGIRIQGFKDRFGRDFAAVFSGAIEVLVEKGLMRMGADACRLTLEGMVVMDSIVARLVARI